MDSQLIRLFSPDGAITKAHGGTLFVDEVEYLTPQAQYRLLRLIDDGLLINGVSSEPAPVSVRVLAGSGASLRSPAADGSFRTDLYYALSAVSLELPSIDGCFNETERWAEYYIRMFCDQYSRNVNLTRTARTAISRYSWEGGLAELKSFCRRLVISSPKLIADENMVQQLLPNKLSSGSKSLYDAESGSEAARLSSLLEMYGGNRTIVAEKMGVSKTTLWRRLKKYGLQ